MHALAIASDCLCGLLSGAWHNIS